MDNQDVWVATSLVQFFKPDSFADVSKCWSLHGEAGNRGR